MGVDLRNNTWFQRMSLVLLPDCLVKLEHQSGKDRVRKMMFNRVQSVAVWRRLPWVTMLIATLILGPIGLLLFFLSYDFLWVKYVGIGILVVAMVIDVRCLWCGKTFMRISYGGKVEEISGIFSPGKVRKLVARMRRNILQVQGMNGES